ncbi:MAG: response regulator [Rickettsiales bacterium]|nr:response regulator [Rickettsiales bacterium]
MIDEKYRNSLREPYQKYDIEELYKNRLSLIIVISIIFIVFFGALDVVMYKEVCLELIMARLVVDLFLMLTLFVVHRKLVNLKLVSFIWSLAVIVLIDVLIIITGEGPLSPYYAGLNLVIVSSAALLSWKWYEMSFICILMLVSYAISSVASLNHTYEVNLNFPMLINNLFFLFSTSCFCTLAAYLNYRQRFKEFCLNYELEEKNKKLAAIDEMKSEFFANVSHEFRTPLTLILGPIQDVLHGSLKLPDKVASILDIIQQNALRLLKLVNDLLDVTKLEERKFNVKLQKTEANKLIGGLADSMALMASSKEIEIVKNISKEDLFIAIDADAMEKIILNLLNNAIKFTPNGGVINVSTVKEIYTISNKKQGEIQKENIVITVKDNGIGIDAENLPHIFERFKQVDSSSTRKYQGTGLGLSLVKELTELQGGKVKVESAPNQGTSFALIFPAFEEQMLAKKEEIQKEEVKIEANPSNAHELKVEEDKLSNIHKMAVRARKVTNDDDHGLEEVVGKINQDAKTILVADDEPDMRYYIVSILKEEGYNIIQSKDGRAALEMVKKYNPDLIVLDLMMPEIDGLSVCDIIRKDENMKMTKIIMLTARSDEGSKIKALQNGVDDFVNKPFGSTEIKSRIKNLLQNSELQKEVFHKNLDLTKTLTDLRSTQAQLVQSEKINAIGSLSAGLLHEVNNPLNYTMTAVQLMKMEPAVNADADLKDTLKDIEEGMTRIKDIVSDLRAFAYPEEADKKVQFPIRDAIESTLRFTASETKDIEKIINVAPELMVSASKTHIVQVLINLVSNAARAISKANREKGVITIDAKEENGRIKISVSDNGTGMNEETLKRVFDPFFTTNEVGKGMGLGLSVSHTIIKNHGGNLAAESVLGEGSKFYFEL